MQPPPANAIERLFAAAGQLPTIPRVVQKLIETLRDEDANLQPLIADIRTDPTISARVLRLANSGFYGTRRSVGSIDEAVTTTSALAPSMPSAGTVTVPDAASQAVSFTTGSAPSTWTGESA